METASLDKIQVVTAWGKDMDNHNKVPSVYSYSPASARKEQQWGASISPKAVTMVNTKMELDVLDDKRDELELIIQLLNGTRNLGFEAVKNSKGRPEYTSKTPDEIVTDYLTKIYEYVQLAIQDFGAKLLSTVKVDIVMTVPVVSFPCLPNQNMTTDEDRNGHTALKTQPCELLRMLDSTKTNFPISTSSS